MTIDASKQLLSLVDYGNWVEMNTWTIIIICIIIIYKFITRYNCLKIVAIS